MSMNPRVKLPLLEIRPERIVPCNGCFACCVGDAIFVHPECGDDRRQYAVERYEGRWILKHKSNGDCIYLDRNNGCTIHDRRPVVCRELDCRDLLKLLGEDRLRKVTSDDVVQAAKSRIELDQEVAR